MVRPVPIPNTAVKRSVADGSGFIDSARVGSRHSFIFEPRRQFRLSCFFAGTSEIVIAKCNLDVVGDMVDCASLSHPGQIVESGPKHEDGGRLEARSIALVQTLG